MLIRKKKPWDIHNKNITPEVFYEQRRFFLKSLSKAGLIAGFFPHTLLAQKLLFKKNKNILSMTLYGL